MWRWKVITIRTFESFWKSFEAQTKWNKNGQSLSVYFIFQNEINTQQHAAPTPKKSRDTELWIKTMQWFAPIIGWIENKDNRFNAQTDKCCEFNSKKSLDRCMFSTVLHHLFSVRSVRARELRTLIVEGLAVKLFPVLAWQLHLLNSPFDVFELHNASHILNGRQVWTAGGYLDSFTTKPHWRSTWIWMAAHVAPKPVCTSQH